MPTSPSTGSRSTSARRRNADAEAPDAIELLTEDHAAVKKLFRRFAKLHKDEASADERKTLASEICTMLTVHAQIEEEIFYPAAREALDDADLVDEATVEHASAKALIEQIESMGADEELFDAKVMVLGEYIDHHVKEEQDELFPKIRRRIDIREVGEQLAARKDTLMGQQADQAI